MNADARPLANIFVISAFIRIQEPAPAAYVVDQNDAEVCGSGLSISKQSLQFFAAGERQPTLALIFVGGHDLHAVFRRVASDHFGLVFG